MCLIKVTVPCEYWLAFEHFTKDAANAPHINGSGVTPQLQKEFWWSVPSSHNQRRVFPSRLTTALTGLGRLIVIWPRETKISDL